MEQQINRIKSNLGDIIKRKTNTLDKKYKEIGYVLAINKEDSEIDFNADLILLQNLSHDFIPQKNKLLFFIQNNEVVWIKIGNGVNPLSTLSEITISGKSAYQIAVDNGYIGSESEWLTSLGGGQQNFTHIQGVMSDSWQIIYPSHLSGFPHITITDTAGRVVLTSIKYINNQSCEISFALPQMGTAFFKF